jgi:hypothetical protein
VQRRLLIFRNVLKAWLVVTGTALLFGAAGWQLGGYRLALLFLGSIVLLAAAVYWYADRIVLGMVGARELVQGEAPALHSTVERLAAARAAAPGSRSRSGCSASPRRRSSRESSRTSSPTSDTATCSSRRSR